MYAIANELKEDDKHYHKLKEILLNMRFLPAGRIQSAVGAVRKTTPFNCYVSKTIEDNSESIMDSVAKAFQTMRLGGGIGYDFSNLRPKGDKIKSLDSVSSGPVSFMHIFDATCRTVSSAGHRRGAQMAVLRVDHPDIEEFVSCKQNDNQLTHFNISVAITDVFIDAVKKGTDFNLVFEGKVYKKINARHLWDKIMRSTWDYAEPGVIFIDTMNKKNNLYYCEKIAATNPCAEQPLPPNGACLLGSFNLTKFIYFDGMTYVFDFEKFRKDIYDVVPAIDNVIDTAQYPLDAQEREAKNKRRMGLGITGFANTSEIMGYPYGSKESELLLRDIMICLRDTAYRASIELAKKKGPFPLFDKDYYCKSNFVKTLPSDIQEDIKKYGIRNSHLLSVAPTGTISLCADNISSGIEPVFSKEYTRTVNTMDGQKTFIVTDYAYKNYNIEPVSANELTPEEHVTMLCIASEYVDSSVSKTCNVGNDVSWDRFKNIYMSAYDGGASGCTTFRAAGKRFGILNEVKKEEPVKEGTACYIDSQTREENM